MIPYVELRAHSEYSIGHAIGKLDELFERAAELGMPAIGVTERDSFRSVYDLYDTGKSSSVRPIYGVEISVVEDMTRTGLTDEERAAVVAGVQKKREQQRAIAREARRLGVDRCPTMCLRAATDEGVLNLYAITTAGWTEGAFAIRDHVRPRVDMSVLRRHASGLAVSVGGADAFALERFLRGDAGGAIDALEELLDVFDGRVALELHPHLGLNVRLNQAVVKLAAHLGVPLIAAVDTRYVYATDVDMHTVVLCLRTKRNGKTPTLQDPEHPRSQAGYHLMSGDELASMFAVNHPDLPVDVVRSALEGAARLAEGLVGRPHVDALRGLIPQVPGVDDPVVELRRLVEEGWTWRDIPARAVSCDIPVERYREQLEHELGVLSTRKLEPYFLVVHDVVGWARREGIFVGPGRGSAAGSLVSYLIGITAIDPLQHGLMFDRFLAPGRNDMPDIDVDFPKGDRERVIEYVRGRYGHDHVAHISTHGVMHGAATLKNVCRVMGVPHEVVNEVTRSFSSKQGDEEIAVIDVLLSSQAGQRFVEEYGQVMDVVSRLEGSVGQVGVHASGVLVSPVPLSTVCPVETHRRKGEITTISAIDMDGVSKFGLLKLDILGINLDVLSDVRAAVWERHGIELDFERLDFDDQEVIDGFTRGEFTGVFQYDAQSARSVCADIVFGGFHDVVALTALNRPGCTRSGLTERFRRRRQDPALWEPLHPIYDAITEETLGVLVYQEQLIRICRDMGGFTPQRADEVRRIIGKKLGVEKMEEHRPDFVAGAIERKVPFDDANLIYDTMVQAGEYSFNVSHSTAYAAIGYWDMWCKVHYPTEFVWALMNGAEDQTEAVGYVGEARRLGVEVLGPDVNESGAGWTLIGERIRAGLRGIMSVGPAAVDAIVAGQPFTSASDFFTKVSGRAVNSRVFENLVRAGAMRAIFPCTKWTLEHRDEIIDLRRAGKDGWEGELDAMVAASTETPEYDSVTLNALIHEVCPQGLSVHPLSLYDHLFEDDGPFAGIEWLDLDDPDFWSSKGGFIAGIVTDVKFNTVGDFGGSSLDDREKERRGWGRRFAVLVVESRNGTRCRVKLDPDTFDKFGDLIGRAKDKTCVIMHVDVYSSGRGRGIRAHYVADLEVVRQKIAFGIRLSHWERCFTLQHPVSKVNRKRLDRRATRQFDAPVLVTHVKEVTDKNGNEMGFFGAQDGAGGYMECVVFASIWQDHGRLIRPGRVIVGAFKLERSKKGESLLMDERGVVRELGFIDELDNAVSA